MEWIDMHCDTLSALVQRHKGALWENDLCVDIKRLKSAGAAVQFFACYVNVKEIPQNNSQTDRWDAGYEKVLSMIEYARQSQNEKFFLASSGTDIMKLWEKGDAPYHSKVYNSKSYHSKEKGRGLVAGILTVEEGGVLNRRMERLDELYDKGVRLMTLTWNYENCIGSPNSRNPEIMSRGMTPFGMEVVRRMNELGMIIDVSHLSDGGYDDCIRYSSVPVIASHSNARALCPHPRNLSDDMLRLLGEKGGVAGLNFYSPFLKAEGKADIEDIARHATYMIDKAGEDAVALGSDLDGFEKEALPDGIQGAQDMQKLLEVLEKSGLTPRQTEKIAYKNAMRILREII